MPNLMKQIPETMRKQGIAEEVLGQIITGNPSSLEEIMAIIKQMDELLTKEQRLSVMQEQGCCKSGIGPKAHLAFGKEHAGMPEVSTIAERSDKQLNATDGRQVYSQCVF